MFTADLNVFQSLTNLDTVEIKGMQIENWIEDLNISIVVRCAFVIGIDSSNALSNNFITCIQEL